MLTPQELREKTFEKAMFGGYDMGGVDDFLDAIAGDYAALHNENAVLKGKMKVLVEKIEEYRATEDGMRRAILAAQKMSDEQVAEATEKSAAMMKEAEEKSTALLRAAEEKAASMIRDAQTEVAVEEARLSEAKKSSAQYIERMRLLCSKQLDFFSALSEAKPAAAIEEKKPEPAPAPADEDAGWDTVRSIEDSVAKLSEEPDLDVKPAVELGGVADSTDEPTRLFDFESLRFGDK